MLAQPCSGIAVVPCTRVIVSAIYRHADAKVRIWVAVIVGTRVSIVAIAVIPHTVARREGAAVMDTAMAWYAVVVCALVPIVAVNSLKNTDAAGWATSAGHTWVITGAVLLCKYTLASHWVASVKGAFQAVITNLLGVDTASRHVRLTGVRSTCVVVVTIFWIVLAGVSGIRGIASPDGTRVRAFANQIQPLAHSLTCIAFSILTSVWWVGAVGIPAALLAVGNLCVFALTGRWVTAAREAWVRCWTLLSGEFTAMGVFITHGFQAFVLENTGHYVATGLDSAP